MSSPEATDRLGDLTRRGRALRAGCKRAEHAVFRGVADRDALAILEDQNRTRLADLVPVRMGRLVQSPFAFFRGGAAVMAHDLAREPRTGIDVVVCGDAHIANFGLYASPERRLVADLNDFDEATFGPWEWDVKRLAASVVVGGRQAGMSDAESRDAATAAVRRYRVGLAELLELTAIERYYHRVESTALEAMVNSRSQRLVRRTIRKARARTSERVMEQVGVVDAGGRPRIVDQPPIVRHGDEGTQEDLERVLRAYRGTLRADLAVLLNQFEVADAVLRVVGVGSVGTRCYIALLVGPRGEPLFLQAKEASASVLVTYGGLDPRLPRTAPRSPRRGVRGFHVVSAQRILQAVSDPFLGWVQYKERDYYVRQFRDMKGSVETEALGAALFHGYAELCGALLARAHSQSPAAASIAGYLGKSDRFDGAVASWAVAYADQNERDHDALRAAIKTGRVAAEQGV
jgi:uncharacterized protein (DUF2252 family)